jgi:hypothetical protein
MSFQIVTHFYLLNKKAVSFEGTTAKTLFARYLKKSLGLWCTLFDGTTYETFPNKSAIAGTWGSNYFPDGYCESVLQDQVLQLIVYTELN